jgi:hypothetical protein
MDVILYSSDAKRLHLVFTRDAAHVGPKARLDSREDGPLAILGGEETMKQRRAVGV